jgi:hypothetical protein
MKAFLSSVIVLLVVAIGTHFVLKPMWETPSSSAYTGSNVRL